MSFPSGILFCLMLVSIGLTVNAIAAKKPIEKESNAMDTEIKSRSDDPDFDELSSFFDFEIGPPSITYKEAEESNPKRTFHARPNSNKNYYYYHSDKSKKPYYHIPTKKVIVTPGTVYSPPTEKTFIEDDSKSEEQPVLNQAKVGKYQVSIVDADSPLLSNLGLTPEDLKRLTGYEKSIVNSSMVASDSTQSETYAENPRPDHQSSGYQTSNSQNAPSYQPPYDTSNRPPPPVNYGERYSKPSDSYHPSNTQSNNNDYNNDAGPRHPPPQGSYDAKSYREVQSGYHSNSNGYAPPYYNPPQSQNYNNPSQSQNYNNPPQSQNYNNPPQSQNYNNPPPPPASSASYSNSHQSSRNYHQPSSSSSSYSPQRSSGEPWRQVTQHHTDWDDSKSKKENWQSGQYPPHPPPLPYSSTSSNTGYHQKPSYASTSDQTGHRHAASYRPDSKPSYGSSSGITSNSHDYSSDRPHYSSSSYSSSPKMPSRTGTVKIAASSPHHYSAPSKPGITIRFKAKAPGGHHGGVNIPVNLSALDVVKRLVPSLNPFNNKKITIGVTIENKDQHPTEIHPY